MLRELLRKTLGSAAILVVVAGLSVPATAQTGGDTKVSVGSPDTPFPQNKQNEPSVAIDPANPSVVAAGANEEIDEPPCVGSSCPFVQGIGGSGVYFSFNGGASWTQPTYTGYGGRDGTPDPGSPIGTLPNYAQNGLVSDGDPVLAFGPAPGAGGFSWSNGSRLYYANLAANFSTVKDDFAFKGFEAIAVSHTDDIASAAAGSNSAWSDPAIVSSQKQSSSTFSDKPWLTVDDAATSPHFGNVYVCYSRFRSVGALPVSISFSRSTDGGVTWTKPMALTPSFNSLGAGGRQFCGVQTDSHGVVYVVWEDSSKKQSVFKLSRSFDGGLTFDSSRAVAQVADVGVFDGVRSISFDGVAGARTVSAPSLDVANGAPSGTGAPNTLALGWSDARDGLNHEHALVQLSTNGGSTWSTPVAVEQSGDRPDFTAISLSPDGTDLYTAYDGFLDPFRLDTSSQRRFKGVVRHSDVSGSVVSSTSTLYRGAVGDARASSANALIDEFIGDYNMVAATNAGAVAVFNDARNAAVCPAINVYRQSIVDGSPITAPSPATDCPASFGNTDIFSTTLADPT
jgi:hypothetical protein